MLTIYERNLKAAEYSRQKRHERRMKKRIADARVQRVLLASALLFTLALGAYIITL